MRVYFTVPFLLIRRGSKSRAVVMGKRGARNAEFVRCRSGSSAPGSAPGRRRSSGGRLLRERRHIDREAVLHVGLEQPFVGFVDLLDGNDLDVRGQVMRPAEVE